MPMTRVPEGLPPIWPPDLGLNGGSNVWVRLAVYFGPSILAAGFLLWFVTSNVSTSIAAMNHKIDEHINVTTFYMRAICLNVATSDVQRANCELPR